MFVQENLTTTPHEVPGVSWELPEALAGKFRELGAFAKLALDENRTRITDIVEDTEKRAAVEAESAREEAEKAEIKEKREKRAKALALEEQGIKTMARVMFRSAAPRMVADDVIACRALAAEWKPGSYAVGDVRNADGVPFRCVQAHDSTGSPDWSPVKAPALWAAYHGRGPETALPWVQPSGAHDLYQAGECMVWTDGRVLRAVQATSYSPGESPGAWEEV